MYMWPSESCGTFYVSVVFMPVICLFMCGLEEYCQNARCQMAPGDNTPVGDEY